MITESLVGSYIMSVLDSKANTTYLTVQKYVQFNAYISLNTMQAAAVRGDPADISQRVQNVTMTAFIRR